MTQYKEDEKEKEAGSLCGLEKENNVLNNTEDLFIYFLILAFSFCWKPSNRSADLDLRSFGIRVKYIE